MVAGYGGLREHGGDDSLCRLSRLPGIFRGGFADLEFGADPAIFAQGALRTPLGAGFVRIVNGAGRRGTTLREWPFLRGLELFIEHALQQGNLFGLDDRVAERLCLGQNVPHIPASLIHVYLPMPLAAALGIQGGEEVSWELLERRELHLLRKSPSPPKAKRRA